MKVVLLFSVVFWMSTLPEVKVVGTMRKIMQEADFSPVIYLDTIRHKENTYGLGPAANLKGEIIMVNGKVFVCFVDEGKPVTKQQTDSYASLFVYASVTRWSKHNVKHVIKNITELESILAEMADKQNFGPDKPFPFIIKVKKGTIQYHIIDWKDDVIHTPQNHKQFAYDDKFQDEPLTIIGFYSTSHQGIFTHHTSKIHMHVINQRETIVGHVDDIEWNEMELQLPAI